MREVNSKPCYVPLPRLGEIHHLSTEPSIHGRILTFPPTLRGAEKPKAPGYAGLLLGWACLHV